MGIKINTSMFMGYSAGNKSLEEKIIIIIAEYNNKTTIINIYVAKVNVQHSANQIKEWQKFLVSIFLSYHCELLKTKV